MFVLSKHALRGLIMVLVFIVFNCKDLGTPPPPAGLRSATPGVSVIKGSVAAVSLSGGTTPYSIIKQPDPFIATAVLNSSSIEISGVDTGTTSIVVGDSKLPSPDTVEIRIIVVTGQPQNVFFSGQIQPIFNSSCAGCHGTNGGLTLTSGVSYGELYHVPASSSCTSLHRVLPGDVLNSVLYIKVAGTACGDRMPLGGSLSQIEIDLIRDWIDQGALNN